MRRKSEPMHQFAPVGPHQLLWRIPDHILGRYHLVLAHDIVENRDNWQYMLPLGSTVIIDNSIIELGEATSLDTIIEAHNILSIPTDRYRLVVVPPEKLNDPEESNNMFVRAYGPLQDALGPNVEMMYIIQGPTFNDVQRSISHLRKRMYDYRQLRWVGIPRSIVERVGTRMYALLEVLKLKLEFPSINIHLLGFSDNIADDIMCASMFGVAGIDSAVPLRLGQKHIPIDLKYIGDQAGPRGNYWEDKSPPTRSTIHNLLTFKAAISSNTYLHSPILTPESLNHIHIHNVGEQIG